MASSNQGNPGNQGNQSSQVSDKETGSSKDKDASKNMADSSNRGPAAMDPAKPHESADKSAKPAQGIRSAQELAADQAKEAARKGGQSGTHQSSSTDKR